MLHLSFAARTIPIGTAYAAWVGIGALGPALLGSPLFHERRQGASPPPLPLVSIVGAHATIDKMIGFV